MNKSTKRVLSALLTTLMVLLLLPLGMFSIVGVFDETHVIYADKSAITLKDATATSMDGDRIMFKIPTQMTKIIILPLADNATFTYLGDTYSFGEITNDTIGIFTLETSGSSSDFTITTMLSYLGNPNTTHFIYANKDAIIVDGTFGLQMIGDSRNMFEIPAHLTEVIIVPLIDNAAFQLFDGTTFRFGKINEDTYGIFTLATVGENPTPASLTIINPAPHFWDNWPAWAQWTLEYILFGWIWMRWF